MVSVLAGPLVRRFDGACALPCVPRAPRSPLAAAAGPARAMKPVSTVLILSDRSSTEFRVTPLLRLRPPLGTPSATALDAHAAPRLAARLLVCDLVARFLQADWWRDQQSELACLASFRYIILNKPLALPCNENSVLPFVPALPPLGD